MPQSISNLSLALAISCIRAPIVGALSNSTNASVSSLTGSVAPPTGSYASGFSSSPTDTTNPVRVEQVNETIPAVPIASTPPSEPGNYQASMLASMRESPLSLPTNFATLYDFFGSGDLEAIPAVASYFAANGTSSPSTPSSASATITSAPSSLCKLQNADPDQFINRAQCLCGSITLSVLSTSPSAPSSALCAYTSLPLSAQVSAVPKQVTTINCQVCTLVSNAEDSCSMLPGCTPTSSIVPNPSTTVAVSKPSTTVAVSNNPVHVGNLIGEELFNGSYYAMLSKCPSPVPGQTTQCNSTGAPVDYVTYVLPGLDGDGSGGSTESSTVTFTIEDSSYTTDAQRHALLGAAASAINGSASGKACWQAEYDDIKCEQPNDVSPIGKGCERYMTVCDAANLVTVWVVQGGEMVASLNVEISFEIDGLNSAYECDEVISMVTMLMGLEAWWAPELIPADEEVLGEIESMCGDLNAEAEGNDPPPAKKMGKRALSGINNRWSAV